MAEIQHTLQETIDLAVDLAVKLAVQKAKLDMHPIGKTWLTFGDENPADIVGGYGSALRHTASSAAMMTMRPVQ